MSCAILITTRNRLQELQRTCRRLSTLSPQPDEVIICADGCNDGTLQYLATHHPEFRVIEHKVGKGSIPSRNELIRAAHSEIVISLDDDSFPIETDFIARVEQLFARSPNLAVASFPQRTDEFPETLGAQDFGPAREVATYANSAAAIRRRVLLELGCYPAFFVHAYEEPDFALRCRARGYEVRFDPFATVRHHWTSSQRNELRTHWRHARNEVWSVLLRCPVWAAIPIALFRVARQFQYACGRGWEWVAWEPRWWIDCLVGIPECLRRRCPVPWSQYRDWLRLLSQS